MGSSELWDQISQYSVPRIAFKKFVSDFVEKNGRFPRIAVDGYLWLFECGYFDVPKNKPKTLLNWLRKLKEMLHLNCFIVVVFDGTFKFDGKRQKRRNAATLWESYWLMSSMKDLNHDHLCYVDSYILKCCQILNIEVVNAPGEGEAQCAYLQNTGEVDFVLSNDADVLSFGARKVLKNYSKHGWDDLPNSSNSPSKSKQNERFVTYVDLESIPDWDRNRFILFNLLVGNDYNIGVKNLGGKRAAILAKIRDPDVSGKLDSVLSGASFNGKEEVQQKWDSYGKDILQLIKEKGNTLFGVNLKSMNGLSQLKDWPDVTVGLFYKDAIVHRSKLRNNSTKIELNIEALKNLMKTNGIIKFVADFEKWLHEYLHHCFIVSFIWQHPDPFNGSYRLTEYRNVSLCDNVHRYKEVCVRYKSFLPIKSHQGNGEPFKTQEKVSANNSRSMQGSPTKSVSKSPTKSTILRSKYPHYVWLPSGVIPKPLLNHLDKELSGEEARQAMLRSSRKTSPNKTRGRSLSPQKSTLDRFLNKRQHTESPVKNLTFALLQEQSSDHFMNVPPSHETAPNKFTLEHIPHINLVDTDSDSESYSQEDT
ncbi:unnamed protein product [Kluyveromyces dobzhanskii CBS 2104]|uniref:WGS project CCBQ000000000 data, contig 00028 n=1 Tax=Kluyveromyces dobzhanskii CBS 2104 TaxID=1427455 RepID=A0A0A8L0K7_9SACH|nr:unnamed protein product [Kluyveromyces dobzhanskii CBS 2104]